jgi:hypothetical protein
MRVKRVLLLSLLLLCFIGFSGSQEAPARHISEQCKADLRAVAQTCAQDCSRDLRCFIRCVVTNFPASCRN